LPRLSTVAIKMCPVYKAFFQATPIMG